MSTSTVSIIFFAIKAIKLSLKSGTVYCYTSTLVTKSRKQDLQHGAWERREEEVKLPGHAHRWLWCHSWEAYLGQPKNSRSTCFGKSWSTWRTSQWRRAIQASHVQIWSWGVGCGRTNPLGTFLSIRLTKTVGSDEQPGMMGRRRSILGNTKFSKADRTQA